MRKKMAGGAATGPVIFLLIVNAMTNIPATPYRSVFFQSSNGRGNSSVYVHRIASHHSSIGIEFGVMRRCQGGRSLRAGSYRNKSQKSKINFWKILSMQLKALPYERQWIGEKRLTMTPVIYSG